MLLNQREIDKQRAKEKYSSKIQAEADKMSKELESKLRRQREILQVFICVRVCSVRLLTPINVYIESNERERGQI